MHGWPRPPTARGHPRGGRKGGPPHTEPTLSQTESRQDHDWPHPSIHTSIRPCPCTHSSIHAGLRHRGPEKVHHYLPQPNSTLFPPPPPARALGGTCMQAQGQTLNQTKPLSLDKQGTATAAAQHREPAEAANALPLACPQLDPASTVWSASGKKGCHRHRHAY